VSVENAFADSVHRPRAPEVVSTSPRASSQTYGASGSRPGFPRRRCGATQSPPLLMDHCRSSDGMMTRRVAAIQVARRAGAAPVPSAIRPASPIHHIVAPTSPAFWPVVASMTVSAFFFLDRLLARLMPDQQLFFDLRPLFRDYLLKAVGSPMPRTNLRPPRFAPDPSLKREEDTAPVRAVSSEPAPETAP